MVSEELKKEVIKLYQKGWSVKSIFSHVSSNYRKYGHDVKITDVHVAIEEYVGMYGRRSSIAPSFYKGDGVQPAFNLYKH